MKLSEFAKKNSIKYQAAYNMFKTGLIKGHQLPTGTIVIDVEIMKNNLLENFIHFKTIISKHQVQALFKEAK